MGNAIGSILPQAIGVALSPVPIIAVILMLFSKRASSNGLAFLLGWVLALLVVGGVVLLLASLGKIGNGGSPSIIAGIVKLLIGVLFLLLALRQWRSRPKEGEQPQMPKWMATIDQFSAGQAFGLSAVLAGVNPKNLGLTLAAALVIAQAKLDLGQSIIVLVIFVVLASLSIAGPVVYYLAARASAAKALNSVKTWLIANNATVMFVLFLILGVKLIGESLSVFFA